MSDPTIDSGKRTWIIASGCAGVVGAGFAAVPFVSSFQPSERARAAGAPVEVDIGALKAGEKLTVEWRGQPVWIIRRTPEQVAELPKLDPMLADPTSKRNQDELTPSYARNEARSIKPEWLVIIGICTHLGCVPDFVPELKPQPFDPDWKGGFYCPCHKSRYDIAGRVYNGVPAPKNLPVPTYNFIDDTTIQIGVDPKGAV